jgi:two-component system sensor histidine kinase KdpD
VKFRRQLDLNPYVSTLVVALCALVIALLIDRTLDAHSPSRVFLVAVLVSAIAYGLWPALFASLISAVAYDYFFLPPVYSLSIDTYEGVIDFGLFVLVSLIVSGLAARVRRYTLSADARALTAEALSTYSQCLAQPSTVTEILDLAAEQMSALLGSSVAFILTEGDFPIINAAYPQDVVPGTESVRTAVAWWALRPDTGGEGELIVDDWRFGILRGAGETLDLIATKPLRPSYSARTAQDKLLAALVYQTGLAIDRGRLRERLEQSHLHAETERLRSAVLASVSHDLRNPIASITGSVSTLERQWGSLSDASKLLILRGVRNETERLDDFIGKLLAMTVIESKVFAPTCVPVSVLDVVEAALQQASPTFADHRVVIDVPDDLPSVQSDAVLLQQVLYNLVENAVKYTPPGSVFRVVAHEDEKSIRITVLDEGPGIPDADLGRIFDKYYRARTAERLATGSGLGLAICRGFLEVMHGTIEAANREDRSGAAFTVTLPTATQRQLREAQS